MTSVKDVLPCRTMIFFSFLTGAVPQNYLKLDCLISLVQSIISPRATEPGHGCGLLVWLVCSPVIAPQINGTFTYTREAETNPLHYKRRTCKKPIMMAKEMCSRSGEKSPKKADRTLEVTTNIE